MRIISSRPMLGALLLSWAFSACAGESGDKSIPPLSHIATPAAGVLSGGQPKPSEFSKLAEAGIEHVVNLRPPAEQGKFDEGNAVAVAGMTYHNIPIAGADDITFANARRLDQLLAELDGQPLLLHCASGNRVGALIALRARMAGVEVEAAIAEGRRWGLTGLEGIVRERLSASGAAE